MNIYQYLKTKLKLLLNPPKDGDAQITSITYLDGRQEFVAEIYNKPRKRWERCADYYWPENNGFLNDLEGGSLDFAVALLTSYNNDRSAHEIASKHSVPYV